MAGRGSVVQTGPRFASMRAEAPASPRCPRFLLDARAPGVRRSAAWATCGTASPAPDSVRVRRVLGVAGSCRCGVDPVTMQRLAHHEVISPKARNLAMMQDLVARRRGLQTTFAVLALLPLLASTAPAQSTRPRGGVILDPARAAELYV